MDKALAIFDAIEQRIALIVGVAAVAFAAADPSKLSPFQAGVIAAAVAVSSKLAPSAPVAPAPAAPVTPTDAEVNAELP